jgi:hypothetical protein
LEKGATEKRAHPASPKVGFFVMKSSLPSNHRVVPQDVDIFKEEFYPGFECY